MNATAGEQKCTQWISGHRGWGGRPCGKPVKGEWDGTPMCGVHLAAKRKRAANSEAWKASWDARAAARLASDALASSLAQHGIPATPAPVDMEVGVRLDAAAVGALIERLSSADPQ